MPLCGGSILQSRAGPCPVFRKGRCSHRPGKPCAAARLRGGQNRPPYMVAGSGRQHISVSPSRAGRWADEIIGPYAGGSTPQPSSACHACRPRSRRPFALHCRAGVHARREGLRRRPPFLQKNSRKNRGGLQNPGRAVRSIDRRRRCGGRCGGRTAVRQDPHTRKGPSAGARRVRLAFGSVFPAQEASKTDKGGVPAEQRAVRQPDAAVYAV